MKIVRALKSKLLLPVMSVGICIAIWQVLHLIIGGDFLPSPYQVYREAVRMFSVKIGGNTVWMHIYYSLRRVVIAYLLGAATGDRKSTRLNSSHRL